MFKRTLRQHALAAALALSAAAACGWWAWHSLALKTEPVPAAAPGIYIPNPVSYTHLTLPTIYSV